VRYLAFIIAGFFAGISGGLAALNFEIVTAEVVGAARSGATCCSPSWAGPRSSSAPFLAPS
jgi:ABC-type branched-subunit amino acid transport system permease subunit